MGLRSDRSGSQTCIQSDPYHDRRRSQALARQIAANICKDYSLRSRKAQMLCSLHIHLSCPAFWLLWHRMRFRQCDLVPNSCLDTTFQIRVRNRDHLCGRRGAACDSKAIHGLLHSFVCRRAPAPAPARPTRYNLCNYF